MAQLYPDNMYPMTLKLEIKSADGQGWNMTANVPSGKNDTRYMEFLLEEMMRRLIDDYPTGMTPRYDIDISKKHVDETEK